MQVASVGVWHDSAGWHGTAARRRRSCCEPGYTGSLPLAHGQATRARLGPLGPVQRLTRHESVEAIGAGGDVLRPAQHEELDEEFERCPFGYRKIEIVFFLDSKSSCQG